MISLSIVIPAYNEQQRLPGTMERVHRYLEARRFAFAEVLVADDGSRDATAGLVEEFGRSHSAFRVLRSPAGNRGKGDAVRRGMLEAKGEWRLFSDADLSAPIEEADRLLDLARDRNAAVAIGSRAIDRSKVLVHQPLLREYSGRTFNWFMRLWTGLPFQDTQCGFKLFRADAARRIFERQRLDGFSFDVEDLVIAREQGLEAIEVAVEWSNVEGTTVSLATGLKSFRDVLEILRNRRRGFYR